MSRIRTKAGIDLKIFKNYINEEKQNNIKNVLNEFLNLDLKIIN